MNRFDIFDVEITEAVRLQIECDEHGHVIKTVLDVGERVACNLVNFLIVPNVEVQLKQTRLQKIFCTILVLAAFEKVGLTDATLLTVSLVNVDRDNSRSSGYD